MIAIEKELNIENLKKAVEESSYGRIKSYKLMVEILGDKHNSDKKKKDLQLKEWKRYFDYKITGNGSYEIKEIYDVPKKRKYKKPEIIIPEIKKEEPKKEQNKIEIAKFNINTPKMKIYELYQDIQDNSIVIEGYENLCKKLNIPVMNDYERQRQIKELNHFINYQAVADTYIITEVYFPLIRIKFLNSLFLREPDYYDMGGIYSYCDEKNIEFHYSFQLYKELMNKAYYHYHDKINTFYEYPQEKDLRIKIEEIIPSYDQDIIVEEYNNFTSSYENSYKKGFVNKAIGETRKKPNPPKIKKSITVYEKDYKKILRFIKEKDIEIIEIKEVL